MKTCIVGASGKLGQYMIQHCLEQGHEVVGVCRAKSVPKLDRFKGQIEIFPGPTNDASLIQQAVSGCQGVLTVLVPWGMHDYSSGTAQAVLDHAAPDARLIFSCGWHITLDNKDQFSKSLLRQIKIFGWIGKLLRLVDINDQVVACNKIFASDLPWTVVRGSDLKEGPSQGLPVQSDHIHDPILASNITHRIDFALFMVHALSDPTLIHKSPAIVSCKSPSALAHAKAT
jgi:hypothetical protein